MTMAGVAVPKMELVVTMRMTMLTVMDTMNTTMVMVVVVTMVTIMIGWRLMTIVYTTKDKRMSVLLLSTRQLLRCKSLGVAMCCFGTTASFAGFGWKPFCD